MNLTRQQQAVLEVAVSYRLRHRISPTLREIGEELGCSTSAVYGVLQRLKDAGAIERGELFQERSWHPTSAGMIQAGRGLEERVGDDELATQIKATTDQPRLRAALLDLRDERRHRRMREAITQEGSLQ